MTNNTELKRLSEAAILARNEYIADECNSDLAEEQTAADDAFHDAAGPEEVLALIAENDHLAMCARQWEEAAMQWAIERDQFRAEVAGLKTGYKAHERVNGELKAERARSTEREILQLAEIEALRKDAERYRWTCIDGNWVARFHGKWRAHIGEYGDKQPTDWYPSRGEAIDAAMGKGKQS